MFTTRGWDQLVVKVPIVMGSLQCSTAALHVFPIRVCITAKISEECPGNEVVGVKSQPPKPEHGCKSLHVSFLSKQPFLWAHPSK
ncbi:hypothetical protein K443DRAFT_14281 [Laccaria amethystina LaAM-08-1]|uniref:Uncharacterized protein n=1 Tax=Laccaria amethystina LaAM-08-1 TaxID=1095629 RepID=A0A0C9X513_9AGAR|nr:hypothetical protein K443DRAFT_14281 [Laccaria amethystina LaAM-08-1]